MPNMESQAHGADDTHYACPAMFANDDDVECCACKGHDCWERAPILLNGKDLYQSIKTIEKAMSKPQPLPFIPSSGVMYWAIEIDYSTLYVKEKKWEDSFMDFLRLGMNNCYRNRDEAVIFAIRLGEIGARVYNKGPRETAPVEEPEEK